MRSMVDAIGPECNCPHDSIVLNVIDDDEQRLISFDHFIIDSAYLCRCFLGVPTMWTHKFVLWTFFIKTALFVSGAGMYFMTYGAPGLSEHGLTICQAKAVVSS